MSTTLDSAAADAAYALEDDYQDWRNRHGLNPTRAQKARFARCVKAAARCGVAFVPWGEEE